ncbi:MAG: energy transducer TonB [Candidatus Marinimicrobia bacterium]|nr:energy transducer TonB [Candidatus Neomarinimicrobiota bacterium]MCF7903594.1 energy transducer TonB [Candidatus Neomarinimicrobiota bacterium]
MLRRISTVVLMLLLVGCAWFRAEKPPGEILKPTPMGGYEQLSTRIYYPRTIREQGVEGTVTIKAYISLDGRVEKTRISQTLHPELDRIAENAVKRTLFNPASRDGEPLKVWIAIPIVFTMENWKDKSSPFRSFEIKVYPDDAYAQYQVSLTGKLKADLNYPVRFELLLPYNAERVWNENKTEQFTPERVEDENGEWIIFQATEPDFSVIFNYKPITGVGEKQFHYQFMLNHALPDWRLSMVYDSGRLNFRDEPDRVSEEADGSHRYTYDMEPLAAYESRFLNVAIQE